MFESGEYFDDLMVRTAHHSTAIEGNMLTQTETNSILFCNYIPREMSEKEFYEVKNYKKAMEFMFENNEKISVEKIKKYHEIIMKNLIENNGKFKESQNIISGANFETANPYKVPVLLREWCDNLNFRLEIA